MKFQSGSLAAKVLAAGALLLSANVASSQTVNAFFNLRLDPSDTDVPTYQDIKPLLYKYECSSCHTGLYDQDPDIDPYVDIDLTSFPFGLEKVNDDGDVIYGSQEQMIQESIDLFRHDDPEKRMPPISPSSPDAEAVSVEDEALFQEWIDSGLAANHQNLPAVTEVASKIVLAYKRLRGRPLEGELELTYDQENERFAGQIPTRVGPFPFQIDIIVYDESGTEISRLPQWEGPLTKTSYTFFHAIPFEVGDSNDATN